MKKSKRRNWKIYIGSARSYENYFSMLLDVDIEEGDLNEIYSYKLNESFQSYSDVEFSDLVKWTLSQAVCYQILNEQFLAHQNKLRMFLDATEKHFTKLANGFSISLDSKMLSNALIEVDFKFNSLLSDFKFLDESAFDLKKVNKVFVENFVLNKVFGKQRIELKRIYVTSLFFIRESFYCKYGPEGDKKFKAFVRKEIFPNKDLSNFLKHGKLKESRDLKTASEEDREVIKDEQSFDLFYKALTRTIQRYMQSEFDSYPGDKRHK